MMATPIAHYRSTPRTKRPRSWYKPPVLLALITIIAGAVSLTLLTAPRAPGENSPEAGFARDMAIHHSQAVQMAGIARERTAEAAIRTLAADIELTQQAQIGIMLGWLDEWRLPPTGDAPAMAWMGAPTTGPMPGMATPAEIAQLQQVTPTQMDEAFLRLMIRHHRGGVTMAQGLLRLSDRPEVVRLAQGIVASQQSEIAAMQDMLTAMGTTPEPEPATQGTADTQDMAMGHGGADEASFTGSLMPTLRDTLRLGAIPLAVFALAWLVLDTVSRRVRTAPAAHLWPVIAVVGLLASGLLHIGLAPAHFAERIAYGLFFTTGGFALAVIAAAIVALPSRPVYLVGALCTLALIVLWTLFRFVPPPGATTAETVDLVGLATKVVEVLTLAACLALWQHTPVRAHRPVLVGG